MKYSRNSVYNYVAKTLQASYLTINCTAAYDVAPKQFPTVMIRLIDESTPSRNIDLAFQDDQKEMTFEVQVFSNKTSGAEQEAYDIMQTSKAAFKELCFREIMCRPLDNLDKTIHRFVARFQRHVGGGDVIPTLPSA